MDKQLFDSGWEYTDSVSQFPNPFIQWQPVTLPHDAAIERPRGHEYPTGAAGGYAWSGVLTYRKKFTVPDDWRDRSVQIEFEGVYMNAQVLVNGNVATFHPYGYTSFVVDLQPYLVYGAENEINVVVNNSAQPNSRWYSGTGIYRHVWLRIGDNVYIRPWGVFVTTPQADPAHSEVAVATEINNDMDETVGCVLRTAILDANGTFVAQAQTSLDLRAHSTLAARQALTVADAHLWSVDDPYLYTLTSQVLAGSRVLDAERTVFGIRSISIDSTNGFRLNRAPLKLKGGCVHHDNGLLGAASYDRTEARKIELMKAAGFNAIRCAHNPPAPAMLDACDRLGMLVIDETFDCWRMGKNPNDYHLYFEDWWQRDTESMVRRDRNHPSIVLWSIGNEVPERTGVSDGVAWCKKQADCIRALDGTRGITSALPALFENILADPNFDPQHLENMFDIGNKIPTDAEKDRWGIVTRPFLALLDVGGYNYLNNRYEFDNRLFPERVICGTETWPHQAYATWNDARRLPNVIGDFVWTSIDYLGESGIGRVTIGEAATIFTMQDHWPYHSATCGDIDICGFKRPQSYFRDILWGERKEPFIGVYHPQHYGKQITFNPWGWEPVSDTWTFPGWEGKPTRVEVYCADEEVELWVNGVSLGRTPSGAICQNKTTFEVTYTPGTIEAAGYSNGKETGRMALKTTSEPVALRLTADRTAIQRTYGDLAYITVEIVDRNGAVVKQAENEVSIDVAGPGVLLALGSSNSLTEELYTQKARKAFDGRLMAVVRSQGELGDILVKAYADGLSAEQINIVAI